MPEPLLQVDNLKMYFPVRSGIFLRQAGWVKAVDDVSFNIYPGETLGLVGESGCGKSTIGKSIVRLLKPTGGSIRFNGNNIARLSQRKMRPLRPHIQMVFQDPAESLNQRQSIGQIVAEPFVIHRMGTPAARREWVRGLLDRVGLPDSAIDRFPFEFSGGQRQRIGIARALTLNPSLIILDEPVSALDVSVQSQVLNLLLELLCSVQTSGDNAFRMLCAILCNMSNRFIQIRNNFDRNFIIQKFCCIFCFCCWQNTVP